MATKTLSTAVVVCRLALPLATFGAVSLSGAGSSGSTPLITSTAVDSGAFVVSGSVPAGYLNAVLEGGIDPQHVGQEVLVAGGMTGQEGVVTFRVPAGVSMRFVRVRLGKESVVPPATYSGAAYFAMSYSGGGSVLSAAEKQGHILNRIAYGPSAEEVAALGQLGLAGFIEQQLLPDTINETSNTRYLAKEAALFQEFRPGNDTKLVRKGDVWKYFKGTNEPPANWRNPGFDDAAWLNGATGIGYGDDDDATLLADMQGSFLTVYLRRTFELADVASVDSLVLSVDYDDGFVAYLNGTEVARANLAGTPPAHTAKASASHEAGTAEEFDLTAQKGLLKAGQNVLAIQVANTDLTSSDLSMIPELNSRKYLPVAPIKRIQSVDALQRLVHLRGVYSRRQLQAVLAEFWNNHFTTDADKVTQYFDDLENSDATDAMGTEQAGREAAQVEYEEYEFFYRNALGNFGDLLLYSATSPAMLIYLDSVLNKKGTANENYAREILELFGFGVDNRYVQRDIEQLAKCFTGWGVRKVWPGDRAAFPDSSRKPPTTGNIEVADTPLIDLGAGWKYLKGTSEPTPDTAGAPTLGWAAADFDDANWTSGSTGIGYGDNDDATVLSDMQDHYLSVYLRRAFTVTDPSALDRVLLSVDYDDGFVAYLNGVEIARSASMDGTGKPPAYRKAASASHEAGNGYQDFSLKPFLGLLKPAPQKNVLAIQVHNITLDSSDLSILPRLVQRRILPGSIENGDPNGQWTFRFSPEEHDTSAKTLFADTPYQMSIPAGRTGLDGLRDATDVIDAMVNHPSTKEFICIKLINKLVSDEINLVNYKNGTAPESLRKLADDAIAAWGSTTPQGNIRTVLRTLLSPSTQDGVFWSRAIYRSKIKTPVEYINSGLRALNAETDGGVLPSYNSRMGMDLFTRDDPDGWSEIGLKWIDTGTLLERLQFSQDLAENLRSGMSWDPSANLPASALVDANSLIEHFNQFLFEGKLSEANKSLLLRFVTTDEAGNALPLQPGRSDFVRRVRELTSLVLSLPQWHNQ